MLSFQLKKEIDSLLEAFDEASDFLNGLEVINKSLPQMDVFLVQIAESGDKVSHAINSLRNHLSQLHAASRTINVRKFFASLEKFQNRLAQGSNSAIIDSSIIGRVTVGIDVFSRKYEEYIGTYSSSLAVPLIMETRRLLSLLDGFRTALMFFRNNFEEPRFDLEERAELSVVLPATMSLAQFSAKLHAIDCIYLELCTLVGISSTDSPLQIGKVESGSLWAKVFGDSRVIGLMVNFIENGASFVYRNYTKEGKLTAIPRKLEALEPVIELSKKLEEAGVDTTQMKDYIRKAAVGIARDLNVLLDGQAEVTVNGKKHSIGDEMQKQLLGFNAPLRLQFDGEMLEGSAPAQNEGSPPQ